MSWQELNDLTPEELSKVPHNDPRLSDFADEVQNYYPELQQFPGLLNAVRLGGERSESTGKMSKSPKGAQGQYQFMPETRAEYEHDPSDPMASADAAGRYFVDLLRMYNNNPMAAIAHYNGGREQGLMVMAGKEPSYKETRDYLKNVREWMDKNHDARYGKVEDDGAPEQPPEQPPEPPSKPYPSPVTPSDQLKPKPVPAPAPKVEVPVAGDIAVDLSGMKTEDVPNEKRPSKPYPKGVKGTEIDPTANMVEAGNIDLTKRPVVKNKDGTISTVRSTSVNIDGVEVLIPTVSDKGKIMSVDEAVKEYKRTGKHLGKFRTPEEATAYAEQLHKDQEKMYKDKEPKKPAPKKRASKKP